VDIDMQLATEDAVSEEHVWQWYCALPSELATGFLTGAQGACIREYYVKFGLLRRWRRPYFRHHFSRTFAQSARYLLERAHAGTIVDLGCGHGTQALYLAMNGARVVALDRDATALEVLRRRQAFHERRLRTRLNVQVHCTDALAFDFSAVAPIAGVHSMFAFNLMQPSGALLDRIVPHLGAGARLAVQDGNRLSWLSRYVPGRRRAVWSPPEFAAELARRGFAVAAQRGGIVLPPPVWCCLPHRVCAWLDRRLCRGWFLPISYHVLAEFHGSDAARAVVPAAGHRP